MKCQFCSNPATVHLTNIENNQKKEMHLCQSCAESHQLLKQHELNLPEGLRVGVQRGRRHVCRAQNEAADVRRTTSRLRQRLCHCSRSSQGANGRRPHTSRPNR